MLNWRFEWSEILMQETKIITKANEYEDIDTTNEATKE